MDGLDFSNIPFDLIINIANIAVMYVIVRMLVYKPVKKFIASREEKLNAAKAEAAEIRVQADELLEQAKETKEKGEAAYTSLLRQGEEDARAKAGEILEQAKAKETEALEKADRILADARTEAEEIRRESDEKAAGAEANALESARKDVVDLSMQIASRLLEKNITDDDNRRLAEGFFDRLTAEKGEK
ncbi:MAG: ATP synthase F0 subunit B [Clostridia bacterium]|nr:ATP synthase F0 subunit B [Clostridia bacterium]